MACSLEVAHNWRVFLLVVSFAEDKEIRQLGGGKSRVAVGCVLGVQQTLHFQILMTMVLDEGFLQYCIRISSSIQCIRLH